MFSASREQVCRQADTEKDELYKQIGQLKVELDVLRKELALAIEERRLWIDPGHPLLAVQRQCKLGSEQEFDEVADWRGFQHVCLPAAVYLSGFQPARSAQPQDRTDWSPFPGIGSYRRCTPDRPRIHGIA